MRYDPSYFVEKEQRVNHLREIINGDFDDDLSDVFHEVVNTYEYLIDLIKEYDTCFDEDRKIELGEKYEEVAKLFKKYLALMQEIMEGDVDQFCSGI